MVGAPSTVRVGRNRTFPFGTPAQGVHEVYDLGRFPILGGLDLFASVLFTQQFFQRLLVVILEFFRIEMSGFGFDDMRCKIEHVLGYSRARDIVEIILLVTHLVGIAQRYAKDAFTARLQRNRVLSRCEYDPADSDHAFFFNPVPYNGESLSAGISVGHNVIRVCQIEFVDFIARNELIDLDRVLAFDGDRVEFFRLDRNVFVLLFLVPFNDALVVDLFAGLRIDLDVADAVAGFSVDLMETDLFALGSGGEKRDRTRDERKTQKAFPVGTSGYYELRSANEFVGCTTPGRMCRSLRAELCRRLAASGPPDCFDAPTTLLMART
jgi:hypothetical protein